MYVLRAGGFVLFKSVFPRVPTFCATMKRGFLRKAFDKEKRLADKRNDREPQPSNQKDVTQAVQDFTTAMKLLLPTSREGMYRIQRILCVPTMTI